MSDIEKAERLFRDAGLGFPSVPSELAAQLKERDRWLFSTRPLKMSPYNLQHYVHEAEQPDIENYAVLCHSGHGANSYAIQYYLVQGPLHMFLHLGWGGVHMDAKASAAEIRDCFSMADQVVAAAQEVGRFQAGEHLTVVGSDFYGSYWLPPGESRRVQSAAGEHASDLKPRDTLTEALAWLTSTRGGKRPERGSTGDLLSSL